MSDELIYGETYANLFRAFAKAYNDLGRPPMATFDPSTLHDVPVDVPLIRASFRAEAMSLLWRADQARNGDALPYDDWAYEASERVVLALLDEFADRRSRGVPIPEPFLLPPPAA